jgi:hypothetical protein
MEKMNMESVQCWNCNKYHDAGLEICPHCESDALELDPDYDEPNVEKCCENCDLYKPASDVECIVLAKRYKRDFIEIDSPFSLMCATDKGDSWTSK